MREIRFELNRNIDDVARESGVQSFSKRDVAGYISYSINNIANDVVVKYIGIGHEISISPLFAFTMYTDRDRDPLKRVEAVTLQLDAQIKNHEEARAFINKVIKQFARNKWRRYHDPEIEPLLTGRSSLLREDGSISHYLMTIDPAYSISDHDWLSVLKQDPTYRWIDDGVLASFDIHNDGDDTAPIYRFFLNFDVLAVKRQVDAENLARELKEGDAKGWHSTAEHEANKKKSLERKHILEENAIKRGDSVVAD